MTYRKLSHVRSDLGYYRFNEILFAMVMCIVVMIISILYYFVVTG